MAELIRAYDNRNAAIVQPGATLSLTYFNLVRLAPGEVHRERIDGCELCAVVLSGSVNVRTGGAESPTSGDARTFGRVRRIRFMRDERN